MRIFKKIIISLFSVIAAVALTVVIIGAPATPLVRDRANDTDFSDVITQGLGGRNLRIVDIAMLGAHDAFSSSISKASAVDPGEPDDSMVRNKTVSSLAKGLLVRLTRSQRGSAMNLLENGVRYLDVRLSNIDGEWYTKHAFVSAPLAYYLDDVITFLTDNPGEFVIFDIQHVYLGDATFEDLFDYLASHLVGGHSLLDFVNFSPRSIPLGTLRYNDVTDSGAKAGVVILAKTPNTGSYDVHYERGDGDTEGSTVIAIRSLWHNTSDDKKMLAGIRSETAYLQSTSAYDDVFRVNQAQKTGVISGTDAIDTIFGWSLIDLASRFNNVLVRQNDFDTWVEAMPIVMVDYATSATHSFNRIINQELIYINQFRSV